MSRWALFSTNISFAELRKCWGKNKILQAAVAAALYHTAMKSDEVLSRLCVGDHTCKSSKASDIRQCNHCNTPEPLAVFTNETD
jgi:hypothetical protein